MTKARLDIALVSLGCPKNLVDSECMTEILQIEGFRLVSDPDRADVVVINTCGFIESAKREAIDAILSMAERKRPNGRCRFLIVTGCLAQRYPDEILASMPEVDAVLGTSAYGRIADAVRRLETDPTRFSDCGRGNPTAHLRSRRRPSTRGFAYLKISEGCSNRCSYCAIPDIRGPFVSRSRAEVLDEARRLVGEGVHELVLVAQDTTRFGLDTEGRRSLPELLRDLSAIEDVQLIRILYAYPDGIDEALVDEIGTNPKVARYLDIPVQHASDSILLRMNRRGTRAGLLATVRMLRERIPGLVLRTTILVGFPGETEAEYEELLSFLAEVRFDRLGAFVFSPEEGTPAFAMKPKVRRQTAERRYRGVMDLQRRISAEKGRQALGSERWVRVESVDEDGVFYLGRSEGEAPEIDPPIHVVGASGPLELGALVRVEIVDANEYELTGVTKE